MSKLLFKKKNFLSMHNLTGSSMVLCSYFCVAYFVQKQLWKFYLWTFLKLLNDIKVIFEPIDLKFWHAYSPCIHVTLKMYIDKFFYFNLENVIEQFYIRLILFLISRSKTQFWNFERPTITHHIASCDVLQFKIAY